MTPSTRLAAATLVAVSLPMLATGTAHASGGDDAKVRRGSCSASADWKIKAKADDGRIEVEGEVDSNRSGQRWHWVLRHNGSVSARGTATTAGRSGSFSVERRTVNAKGADKLTFRAVNNRTDEVCVARVTF